MHVLVFATERSPGGTSGSPFVAVPDSATAALPRHPDGRQWIYFATMAAEDVMLSLATPSLYQELEARGHFIWEFPLLKSTNPMPRKSRDKSASTG